MQTHLRLLKRVEGIDQIQTKFKFSDILLGQKRLKLMKKGNSTYDQRLTGQMFFAVLEPQPR